MPFPGPRNLTIGRLIILTNALSQDKEGELFYRISLNHFLISGDLDSASSVAVTNGTVKGAVHAPTVRLSRATARKRVASASQNPSLVEASAQIDGLSTWLSNLGATAAPVWGSASVRGLNGETTVDGLLINSTAELEVVGIRAEDFAAAGSLVLEGGADTLLIVRIYGTNPSFLNKGVFVRGGLRPEQVIFFFPEATNLALTQGGGAVDPLTGLSWGIPGSVVAPYAVVEFASVLVTGQLFVGRLCNTSALPTGQVNYGASLIIDRYLPAFCGCTLQTKF
ncbi:MAG: choice-of-anchor A family protein [Proteobacteria bacterium]|nr:MAG: choice-of-anchor A family protein [Pseudomonadota bacterium]